MTDKKAAYQIDDLSDFKSWALMEPNARTLLETIIFRWRASTIRTAGASGKWAVYRRSQWQSWVGFTLKQYKTAFSRLCIDGLIQTSLGRFNGEKSPYAFIQPTPLALEFLGRPTDKNRLSDAPKTGSATEKTNQKVPTKGPSKEPSKGPLEGPTKGPTLSLPFPSSSYVSTSSTSSLQTSPLEDGKGKGKAGEPGQATKFLKIKIVSKHPIIPNTAPTPHSPPPPANVPDDGEAALDAKVASIQASKLQAALAKYPKKTGAHEKKVKHPSQKYPGWVDWSDAKKAEKHAQYETYVANWYGGKEGKPFADTPEMTDQEEADWVKSVEKTLKAKGLK